VGQKQIADLHDLRDRAASAPVHLPAVMVAVQTPDGKRRHMKAMDRLTVEIPIGFLVTLSIETGHPVGTCRHMSMSTARKGAAPTQEAVMMVARELGFVGDLSSCRVWVEDLQRGNGRAKAVNVVQPVRITHAPGNA
jgi:hypothetical protein